MSMIINAPTAKVTIYDVANQNDVQFNFDFDPTQMRADGTTLVVEYEGNEIRLDNFFDADGNALVENFLTQDGQVFSAAEFLAAIMGGTEGGDTAEDLETAAGAAAGGSGAGDYSDDAGNLFDGLDALGGQGDAYDRTEVERLDEVAGIVPDGGGEIIYDPEDYWMRYNPKEVGYDPDGTGREFTVVLANKGSAGVDPEPLESVALWGHNRTFTEYNGTSGVDTLVLTDDPWGDALRLEDDFSFPDAGPHISDIEVIQAGAGNDVIDLSSTTFTYDDVTVYGGSGNDVIWTNAGNDTLYGGTGDDSMIGGTGDDVIFGEDGADRIMGGMGNDILNGGEGDDYIFGGAGNDTINLGDGNDKVNAEVGTHDMVDLGDGADTIIINSLSVTDGADTALWDSSDGVDGSAVEVTGFGNDDSLQLATGYTILDFQVGDANGDGLSDLAFFVGESTTQNNTWVVLSDTSVSDLSSDMITMIQNAGFSIP